MAPGYARSFLTLCSMLATRRILLEIIKRFRNWAPVKDRGLFFVLRRTSSAKRFRNDSLMSSSFGRPLTRALPFRPLSLKLPPELLIFCSQLSQRLEEGPHSVCFSIIAQPQGVHPSVYLSRNCYDARFWSFVGSSHGKT